MTEKTNDCVLLIDDEYVSNLIIRKYLEGMGYSNIEVKTNGQDAINYFTSELEKIPDIIFLDLRMPIMDGFDFLDELGNLNLDLGNAKIYIVTSSINPIDMEKSKNYDIVSGFIQKPIHLDNLKDILI